MTDSNELDRIKKLLTSLDMLDEIKNNKTLNFVAKEIISSHTKDRTSTIYRLAMAIYHSGRFGEHVLKEFSDPLKIYIRITEDKSFQETDPQLLAKLRQSMDASLMIRTFISYLTATYLYYDNI